MLLLEVNTSDALSLLESHKATNIACDLFAHWIGLAKNTRFHHHDILMPAEGRLQVTRLAWVHQVDLPDWVKLSKDTILYTHVEVFASHFDLHARRDEIRQNDREWIARLARPGWPIWEVLNDCLQLDDIVVSIVVHCPCSIANSLSAMEVHVLSTIEPECQVAHRE